MNTQAVIQERRDNLWKQQYDGFITFLARSGQPPLERSEDPFEKVLNRWQRTQKKAFDEGTLSAERLTLLNAIPNWQWTYAEASWHRSAEEFSDFAVTEKRRPSPKSKDPKERRLGRWRHDQLVAYSRGNLSEDRLRVIRAIPCWSWSSRRQTWFQNRKSVKSFYLKHGFCPRMNAENDEERHLAIWCSVQHRQYMNGALSKDKIDSLDRISGWTWVYKHKDKWAAKYRRTADWAASTGNRPYARNHSQYEDVLAWWYDRQKTAWIAGTLSPSRLAMMELLPGWNVVEEKIA